MNFWSSDLAADEVRSPKEILINAAEELKQLNHKIDTAVRSTEASDRLTLSFLITHLESGSTLNLFEVSHGIKDAYPCRIYPPESNIPEFLKTKQYVPGRPATYPGLGAVVQQQMSIQNMLAAAGVRPATEGHWIEIEGICSTPSELEEKLKELFSQEYIKAKIISLLSTQPTPPAGKETGDSPATQDSTESQPEQITKDSDDAPGIE